MILKHKPSHFDDFPSPWLRIIKKGNPERLRDWGSLRGFVISPVGLICLVSLEPGQQKPDDRMELLVLFQF